MNRHSDRFVAGDCLDTMVVRRKALLRERRLARRVAARGEPGHVEALLGLKGLVVGGRFRIESLYDVGGESAVYQVRDLEDLRGPLIIGKMILLSVHKAYELESRSIRVQRDNLRLEGGFLRGSGSPFLPKFIGLHEFKNPLLDPDRGGAFRETEPLLLMAKLPGRDLDRWLARTHRSEVPQARMRRTLDRVTVMLLQALVDLYDRGLIYADLRPGNLRVMGRPERIVRLLDAGSLVGVDDFNGRFPHVPSYLPPLLFWEKVEGRAIVPSAESQAVMAGRTLYEVATGRVPMAGKDVDTELLKDSNVSPPVGEVIEGLCLGDFQHVRHAYRYLLRRAARRVSGGNDPNRALGEKVPKPVRKPRPAAAKPATIPALRPLKLTRPPLWKRWWKWIRAKFGGRRPGK